jgi:hypothetical protein
MSGNGSLFFGGTAAFVAAARGVLEVAMLRILTLDVEAILDDDMVAVRTAVLCTMLL